MKSIRPTLVVMAAGLAVVIGSCRSDDPSAPLFPGTTVAILDGPEDGVLLQDSALQLRASVRAEDGSEREGVRVAWRTADARVATVSEGGLVHGVALGETDVIVTGGGASDSRAISVRAAVPLPRERDDDPVTSTLLDGLLRLTVPGDAVPRGRVLHVRLATDAPVSERVVRGTAIELGPDGLRFDRSVTLWLEFPDDVPSGQRSRLRVYRANGDSWASLSGNSVDASARRVRATITRTGTYAVLLRDPAASLAATAGDGQSAAVGTSVPVAPRVVALDAASSPVEGAVVRFAVTSGGGAIVGADTGVADEAGVAQLAGQWRLGGSPGSNTLRAALDEGDVAPVTFSATATTVSLPRITVSHPEVNFDAVVGMNPAPREVGVASTSSTIIGLAVGPVQYVSGGATGWLVATLDRSTTPAVLRLSPASASLPANDYVARVPVRSAVPAVAGDTVTVRLGVRHGATSAIVVTRQLGGAVSGRAATTQPRVEFRTASGALSPVTNPVTAELMAGDGTLRGTTTVLAVNGVAAFTDLRVDGWGSHRLRFLGGGVSTDGAAFSVTQQLAEITILVQPEDAEEDRRFGVQPVIGLFDDAGLPFQPSKTVTASIASGDGDLEGDRTITSEDGISRFHDLKIDDATGVHTLQFRTSSPTRTVVSAPFDVKRR